jgi:hypothetical protein
LEEDAAAAAATEASCIRSGWGCTGWRGGLAGPLGWTIQMVLRARRRRVGAEDP